MGQVLVLELMSHLIWGNFNVMKHKEVVFIYWYLLNRTTGKNMKYALVYSILLHLLGLRVFYPTPKNKRLIFMRQYNRKLS